MQAQQSKWFLGFYGATLFALSVVATQLVAQSVPLQAHDPAVENSAAGSPSVETTAAASVDVPESTVRTVRIPSNPSLHLGPGDLVEMTAYSVPELNTKARVSSKGDIFFPLIGYTHVAGLTTEEAQELIEKRLGEFLKNPQVSIFVAEYASQGASVLGEVNRPGVYPVLGEQHLFDLISAAGGTSERSGHSITVTHRDAPDKPETLPLTRNLADNGQDNVPVFPGDTIIVHKADIAYVVGDVGRPSALVMDTGNITVLKAIALAGGTNHTAKLGGAKILRKTPTGLVETPIQLKKILSAKAPDVVLQADDILVVPSSFGKVLADRSLAAALQSASTLSVIAAQ